MILSDYKLVKLHFKKSFWDYFDGSLSKTIKKEIFCDLMNVNYNNKGIILKSKTVVKV